MPTALGKACASPGCPAVVRGRRFCDQHAKANEQRRGSASSRGYGSRWQRATVPFKRANPLCVMCKAEGITTAVHAVDHIRPHQGQDDPLFWDESNWQSLCQRHHSIKTAMQDGGFGRERIQALGGDVR